MINDQNKTIYLQVNKTVSLVTSTHNTLQQHAAPRCYLIGQNNLTIITHKLHFKTCTISKANNRT